STSQATRQHRTALHGLGGDAVEWGYPGDMTSRFLSRWNLVRTKRLDAIIRRDAEAGKAKRESRNPRGSGSFDQLLQLVEQLQRLARTQRIDVRFAQARAGGVGFACGRVERLLDAEEIELRRCARAFVLEPHEIAARRANDRTWNARELCNLDAVALACRAFAYGVEENDPILVLDRVEVHVGDRDEIGGKPRELEIVRRK